MEMQSSEDDSSSSSSSSRLRFRFEVPLGYVVEDVRPNGGFEKFRRAGFKVCAVMGLEIPWVVEPVGFEGFEKRLEVEFMPEGTVSYDGVGLRGLDRVDVDRMLKAAECTIVAELSNADFDSYVLSESSLFVYPLKMVIKTCGTTKLLNAIPVLLELASSLSLSVKCCKYRRGTFFFPAVQPAPHRSFADEVEVLDSYFGHLGSGGRACVLGNPAAGHQWHVYVANRGDCCDDGLQSPLTLEMCMTKLDRKVAAKFYRDRNETAMDMREDAGIGKLLPRAEICDFAFDPCGYSMNSVEGEAYSTIHVTPEEVCSYASFEAMGYGGEQVELKELVQRVVDCFRPGFFSVSLYVSGSRSRKEAGSWGAAPGIPAGYVCVGSTRQELIGGDAVVYHTFQLVASAGDKSASLVARPLPLAEAAGQEEEPFNSRMKQLARQLACSVEVQLTV